MWMAYYKDSVATDSKHRDMVSHKKILSRWLALAYPSLDGTSLDGGTKAVTEEERADLKEQGLPDTGMLRMVELARVTLLVRCPRFQLARRDRGRCLRGRTP